MAARAEIRSGDDEAPLCRANFPECQAEREAHEGRSVRDTGPAWDVGGPVGTGGGPEIPGGGPESNEDPESETWEGRT